ncbi:MAG: RagB/SusD family nutrient uptake outer membrane protein [Bacteroidales bacterium]
MINKVKYFFITVLVFLSFSCNDWLELLPPSGLIRDEFWQKKEDVETVLMASYRTFANMDNKLFIYGEIRADMLEGDLAQSNTEELLMESNIFPENSYSNWSDFYKVINYANEVIKNAPLVQEIDNTFTDFQMKSLMAEAYFIRSLSYFYLVRLFRDVPLVIEPTETDDAEIYVTQSTEEAVLNQIVADLEANRTFAPSGGFSTIAENKGRASKAAYDALLADIALWQYDYQSVIEHVQRIEDNEDIVLMPGSRWFEIFYPGNSLESIFEFQFDGNLNQNNGMFGLTIRTSYRYDPSQKAIELFAFEYGSNELVRGEDVTIVKNAEDDFSIWKYVGRSPDGQSLRSGTDQNSANWIVYRFADVYLMKAEALSQLGSYQQAADILNEIRERAGMQPVSIANSSIAFEDAILEERARELAYEGKRWFDLLRMGRRNNFERKSKLVEIIINNVPSTQKRILAAKLNNPLGWYYPIYQNEMERNRNLVQNPFYDF